MNFRRLAPWLFVVLVIAGVFVWNFYLDREVRVDKDGRGISVQDGDSFVLQQTTIRLDGIDAPELKQNCYSADGSIWRCGGEARNHAATQRTRTWPASPSAASFTRPIAS